MSEVSHADNYEAYRKIRAKLWEVAGTTSNVERVVNVEFLQNVLDIGRSWNASDVVQVPGEEENYWWC